MPSAYAIVSAGDPRVPRTLFQHAHIDNDARWPCPLATEQIGEIFVLLPDNWNGTDRLVLWFYCAQTLTDQVHVTIDAATCSEAFNTHTQTVNNIDLAAVNTKYICLDITASFAALIAALAARDMLWFKVTADMDFNIFLVGAELQET